MIYSAYSDYITDICDKDDLATFKRNDTYRLILEHVNTDFGNQYLQAIQSFTQLSLEDISAFCTINDSIGGPLTSDYKGLSISPSNLRYIFHSHIILTHLYNLLLPQIDIVEVGGGYGGLCLALHHFAHKYGVKINS